MMLLGANLLLLQAVIAFGGPANGSTGCQLPSEWSGRWYEKASGQVDIDRIGITSKGRCIGQDHNAGLHRALFHYQTDKEDCWRCLAFFPLHKNVIKYKQTECQREGTLEELCSRFFGDSPLYSMFRMDAPEEPCPIPAPANFSYSFYRGECASSVSRIGACASPAMIHFEYQGCHELYKAESKVEDVACLGSWTEKRAHFFLGRLRVPAEFRPGDNFRCFAYELSSSGGRIGISSDSSCFDLTDLEHASYKLKFTTDRAPTPQCSFAKWLRKSGGAWESLSDERRHKISGGLWVTSLASGGGNASTAVCITPHNYGEVHKYVVFTTEGCKSGYQCIRVARRTRQVVEVTKGMLTRYADEACAEEFFAEDVLTFDTLLLETSVETACPNHGRFRVHGCTEDEAQVSFGCTASHQLVVNLKCLPGHRETFNCHGHWDEGPISYLVVKEQHTGKKGCYEYTRKNDFISMAGLYRHHCRLGVLSGVNGHRVFNASRSGVCDPVSAAWSSSGSLSPLLRLLLPISASLLLLT